MRYLLDTHLLLWGAREPQRLSPLALALLADSRNDFYFSAASIWEISIKASSVRKGFLVDPEKLLRGFVMNGFIELQIASEHSLAVASLPTLHRDPFDRLLVAQSVVEGLILLTHDRTLTAYGPTVQQV